MHGTPKVSPQRKAKGRPKGDRVGRLEFVYLDEDGRPLFREVREEYLDTATGKRSKKPWVEAWDGSAFRGHAGCMKGVRLVPFGLPRLLALQPGDTVFVVEGPKKVEKLQALGLNATCNPYGAGKWRSEFSEFLRDFNVVVLPDENKVGRDHAEAVAQSVNPFAMSVRVVPLPGLAEKEDIADWLEKGGTAEELRSIVANAPTWVGASAIRIANVPGADALPEIIIGVDQWRVIDEAEQALVADNSLFTRASQLVRVVTDATAEHRWQPDRPAGSPRIGPIELPTLSEKMSKYATWLKRTVRQGQNDLAPAMPPQWAVTGLLARASWPYLRPLVGVVETPTVRKDGTILDVEGWDPRTGLLYTPGAKFGKISENPTKADAQAAAALLLDLVCDVPFKDHRHAAAWLAALLTVIARHAVDGPTPLFVFSANIRATGKSLLCDLIYAIAAGREMPRSKMPADDEEMNKSITSIAMAADPVNMYDNVASGSSIGSPVLDNVIVGTTHKARLMRTNLEPIFPWHTVLFVTGNNLSVKADTFSRIVSVLIESDRVNPEQRKEFKVKGCLVKHAKSRRVELVEAALVILRAHAVAGRPDHEELPSIRTNFLAWSSVIRAAVHWTTGIDPCEVQEDERTVDRDAMTVDALVEGWLAVCTAERKPAMSVADVLKVVKNSPEEHAGLRELFMDWSRDKELPSSKSVGRRMAQFRKRPSRFGSLDETPPQAGVVRWFVREPRATSEHGGFGGFGGFDLPSHRENEESISIAHTRNTYGGPERNSNPPKPPNPPELPSGVREVGEL